MVGVHQYERIRCQDLKEGLKGLLLLEYDGVDLVIQPDVRPKLAFVRRNQNLHGTMGEEWNRGSRKAQDLKGDRSSGFLSTLHFA